jgi:hypothetical protein
MARVGSGSGATGRRMWRDDDALDAHTTALRCYNTTVLRDTFDVHCGGSGFLDRWIS